MAVEVPSMRIEQNDSIGCRYVKLLIESNHFC